MTTLAESVRVASRSLEAAGWDVSMAWLDAEILARSILGWDLTEWLSNQDDEASHTFRTAFQAAVGRRLQHEPVAYITGEREFYGRPFVVSSSVLIPRPETELVVDEAVAALTERQASGTPAPDVIDVGTGSGILAITLALESLQSRIVATDVSVDALAVAEQNVRRFDVGARVQLHHASLLAGTTEARFDVIVANPPYVAEQDRAGLMADVRDYEPGLALFGGADGLDVIRALVPAAEHGLRAGGWLILEIGAGQAARVAHILERCPQLSLVKVSNDLAGIPRVLVARRAR